MKRLYIDEGIFAIARDGYNAETDPDLRHMKIDTRRGSYFGIFMQGSVDMANMVLRQTQRDSAGIYKTYWCEIPFGKTFEKSPAVIAMYRGASIVGASPVFSVYTASGSTRSYIVPYVDRVRFVTLAALFPTQVAGPTAISYIVAHS